MPIRETGPFVHQNHGEDELERGWDRGEHLQDISMQLAELNGTLRWMAEVLERIAEKIR